MTSERERRKVRTRGDNKMDDGRVLPAHLSMNVLCCVENETFVWRRAHVSEIRDGRALCSRDTVSRYGLRGHRTVGTVIQSAKNFEKVPSLTLTRTRTRTRTLTRTLTLTLTLTQGGRPFTPFILRVGTAEERWRARGTIPPLKALSSRELQPPRW